LSGSKHRRVGSIEGLKEFEGLMSFVGSIEGLLLGEYEFDDWDSS